MARKKNSLSAFTAALDDFGFSDPMQHTSVTDVTDNIIDDDIDDLTNNEPTGNEDNTEGNGDNEPYNDNTQVPENILNNTSNPDEDVDNELNESDHVDPAEATQIGAFFDAFAEELGWDVNDEDKPNSVSGLVDYIGAMIEQNSTPQYADERIAQLDAYVKNGGNFEDFYQRQQQSMSYDNMDLEDESNQKAVVREYLRFQGYDENQINRKIERYEDGDMLEDEASDAIQRLQMIQQQQLAEQQRQQEEARQAQEEQAREFMNNLTNSINTLDSIRGISIPKSDRKELFDYITRVDADGLTRYQKDFNSNMVNNLIESAYFTMKGDSLIGGAKSSGRTSAANKLRTMLRHTTTNHSRYNVDENKQRSVIDMASQYYR